MSLKPSNTLPSDLESIALSRFTTLLAHNEIYYEPPKVDIVLVDGIQFHFSTTSALSTKPILSADDPGRTKPVGPFVNPPESFIVARIGETHTIIVNKYNTYPAMLVLHTTLFVPQTDDLTPLDISISWSLLSAFRTPQIVIYNCGVESGSSQGHKHLQLFPRQDGEGFSMWPNRVLDQQQMGMRNGKEGVESISGIPFKHFVTRLPPNTTAADVFRTYEHLLHLTKQALQQVGAGTDYNLILVPEWILLIPRTSKGRGNFMANAANMAGLMWTRSEEIRDEIIEMGVGGLAGLGIGSG